MESHKRISNIRQYFKRYTNETEEALNFLEWLQGHSLDLGRPSIAWNQTSFRIIYGTRNPLSIAGSLAAGGRFNIGGAQVNHFFSRLRMEACLYAASSMNCAKIEAGDMLGRARGFVIKPNKQLNLWDLQFLIRTVFNYPALEAHINASPLAAIWQYQKVPRISQIMGSFLRQHGGDGLLYPSTKDPQGKVLAFFAQDDAHMMQTFKASEVPLT